MDYVDTLKKIVGAKNVFDSECDRICYSRDMGVQEARPKVVVFPTTKEHVVEIMKLASKDAIPVVPRGAGSSVAGGVIPIQGGIVLDMCKMTKVIEINKEDTYVVVEPGIVCQNLNTILAPTHFFPPDPGSSAVATIGGMISTNASGVRAVKWGTTKDWVMGLEVVLPDGRVITTGNKAPKSSTGYNLTGLLVGSEGTLGIVVKAILKIAPLPEYTAFATAAFNDVESAGKVVTKIFIMGIEPSACEILDKMSIKVVNEVLKMGLPPYEALLIIEVDGQKEAVQSQMKKITDTAKEMDGKEVSWSDDPKERARMWKGRSGLVSSLSRYKKGVRLIPIAEDFGVPVSKIPQTILAVQKISLDNDILIATFGHVGDGNLHATFMIDVRKKEEWAKIRKIGVQLIELAMSMGGTVSAEHGIGLAKVPFMKYELASTMDLLIGIKKVFDPQGILNPGKLGLDGKERDIFDYFAFREMVENPEGAVSFGPDIDDEILVCVQCGFCRAQCPVFQQTSAEATVGRGKVALAYSILTGRIQANAEIADRFFQCTTCANCTATCPSKIKIVEIVEKVRDYLVKQGYGRPEHQRIKENILKTHNPFGEDDKAREELKQQAGGGK